MTLPHRPTTNHIFCLPFRQKTVENFNQRINLIREVRNAETNENSLRRLNNNRKLLSIVKDLYFLWTSFQML